ncbi:MAG: lipid-A-disaccharide synthase [Candidatus Omnitrophica bacterium]|nr:lipid-A-disaccharide synthase [Candidatus Omnitrophota bacterium]
MNKNILIISGEPSGDMRGGELVKELSKLVPDLEFWGIGGDSMKREGVSLSEHIRDFSFVGAWEVLCNLGKIRSQYKDLTELILKKKPRAAILIDYPGFNLRIARFLYEHKIPVIYYIIPQVWAWGAGRVKHLRDHVDKTLVLFKFEETFLTKRGVNAEFAGHPLVDTVAPPANEKREETVPDHFTIALLPGSRKHEVQSLLPVMLQTAEKISLKKPGIRFIVAENSNVDRSLYDSLLSPYAHLSITRVTNKTFNALDMADFAIITSGTATLEAALLKKPMIITYKAAFITFVLYHIVNKAPFLGLVNIIAGKKIVPELLQNDAKSEKLAAETLEIISRPDKMRETKEALQKVADALGEKGAALRAARSIAKFLREKNI